MSRTNIDKVRARYVLDIVKYNLEPQSKEVEKALNVKQVIQGDNGTVKANSINAILNDLKEMTVKTNYDSEFDKFCADNGINKDTVKKITKLKTMQNFNDNVKSICENEKYPWKAEIVFKAAMTIKNALNNAFEPTPKHILNNINKKRKQLDLNPVVAEDNSQVLTSLLIDKDKTILDSKFDYASSINNLIDKASSLGINVKTTDDIANGLVDGEIILSNANSDNLSFVNLLYYLCQAKQKQNFVNAMNQDQDDIKKLKSLIDSTDNNLSYNKIKANCDILTNLVVCENMLFALLPEREYAELSKVLEYNICQKIYHFATRINSATLVDILVDNIVVNTENMYKQLNLSLDTLKQKYQQIASIVDSATSYKQFVLCPLQIDYNLAYRHAEKTFNVNYDVLYGTNSSYTSMVENFRQQFQAKINEKTMLKNIAINDEEECQRIDGIYNQIVSLKDLIEANNHLTESQINPLLTAHAYCVSAQELTEQMSKAVYNHQLSISSAKQDDANKTENVTETLSKNDEKITIDPVKVKSAEQKQQFVDSNIIDAEIVEQETKNSTDKQHFASSETNQDQKTLTSDIPPVAQQTTEQVVKDQKVEAKKEQDQKVEIQKEQKVQEQVQEQEQAQQQEQVKQEQKVKQTKQKVKKQTQKTENEQKTNQKQKNDKHQSEQREHFAVKTENSEKKMASSEQIKQLDQKYVEIVRRQAQLEQEAKAWKAEAIRQNAENMNLKQQLGNPKVEISSIKEAQDYVKQNLAKSQIRIENIIQQAVTDYVEKMARNDKLVKNVLDDPKFKLSSSEYQLANKANENSLIMLTLWLNMAYSDCRLLANQLRATNDRYLFSALQHLRDDLKDTLPKVMSRTLAPYVADLKDQYANDDNQFMNAVLASAGINCYTSMEKLKQAELEALKQQYDDEYDLEYMDKVDAINAKYDGLDDRQGLLQQNIFGTMCKEIIVNELARVQYLKPTNKYTFGEQHIENVVKDLLAKSNSDAQDEYDGLTY